MISQTSALHVASQYAPCLAAAFTGLLPSQLVPTAARTQQHNSSRQAVGAASNYVSTRSINSKEFDADDKLGRPTTPWVRQVISGVDLMRHPKYNKGIVSSGIKQLTGSGHQKGEGGSDIIFKSLQQGCWAFTLRIAQQHCRLHYHLIPRRGNRNCLNLLHQVQIRHDTRAPRPRALQLKPTPNQLTPSPLLHVPACLAPRPCIQ